MVTANPLGQGKGVRSNRSNTKDQASSKIQHCLELLHERSRQACKNTVTEIQATLNQRMHQEKFRLNRQASIDESDEVENNSSNKHTKHVG